MSLLNPTHLFFTASLTIYLIFVSTSTDTQSQLSVHETQGNYLILEISGEGLIELAYDQSRAPTLSTNDSMYKHSGDLQKTLCSTDYRGSHKISDSGGGMLDIKALRPFEGPANLTVLLFDKIEFNLPLTTLIAEKTMQPQKTLIGTRGVKLGIHGLEHQLVDLGDTDMGWEGQER